MGHRADNIAAAIILAVIIITALVITSCGGEDAVDWRRYDCDKAYGRGWSLQKDNVDRPCPALDGTATPQPSPSPTPATVQYSAGLCKAVGYWQTDEDGTEIWIPSAVTCEKGKAP